MGREDAPRQRVRRERIPSALYAIFRPSLFPLGRIHGSIMISTAVLREAVLDKPAIVGSLGVIFVCYLLNFLLPEAETQV